MITLYGIPQCDTVKKARLWLDGQGISYQFHDFKKQGVSDVTLEKWLDTLGWEQVLNRRGTTWRALDEATREKVHDNASAKSVLKANTSAIKRPVVQWEDGSVTVGFSPDEWLKHPRNR